MLGARSDEETATTNDEGATTLAKGVVAAGSCREFLDSIPDDPSTGDPFSAVAEGDDIETG